MAKKKPSGKKLSDILEEAAQRIEDMENPYSYSCCVVIALIEKYYKRDRAFDLLWDFNRGVKEMGLNPYSMKEFDDVPLGERPQARALWLSWCAMMAREQGL